MTHSDHESSTASSAPTPGQDPSASVAAQPAGSDALRAAPLRLAFVVLVLAVYWVAVEASYRVESGMFQRFMTRMLALLGLMGVMVIWWFTRRGFSRGQRWAAFGAAIGWLVLFSFGCHPTMAGVPLVLQGLPIELTSAVAVLGWSRSLAPRRQVTLGTLAMGLSLVPFLFFRWDGLDGRQRPELSWRWRPSAEQQFLESLEQDDRRPTADAPDITPLVADERDWTELRGGAVDGVVRGVRLGDWTRETPEELWHHRVGPGWSSVIGVGDRLFTQEQRGDQEAVVCYDAEHGHEVWVYSTDHRFEEGLSGAGPRATPTFADGRLFTLGSGGHLACLDAASGAKVWTREVFEECSASVPQWGSATSPLAIDGQVVVFVGGSDGRALLAFRQETGEQVWAAAGGKISYSSPQFATLHDRPQILMHDETGLYAVDPADGRRIWEHPSPFAGRFQPMLQPHVVGDRVLVGWDAGMLCLQVQREGEAWRTAELWTSNRLKPGFNDFVIRGDSIFGLDDGILACVDLATGQRRWKRGRYGFGQLLLLEDAGELLVLTESGEVVRVPASTDAPEELGRFAAITGKTWGHPLLSHGRLVVRNGELLACFRLAPRD